MMRYKPVEMSKKKSHVLVVQCSDPRFQEAYKEAIGQLGEYYDLVAFPGASKAIAENNLVIENIKLLHTLHNFDAIHIFDHINCGAFGAVKNEVSAHSNCLQAAEEALKKALPRIKVVPHLFGESEEIELIKLAS